MYEKFEKLLKEKNLSTYRVSKDTGITSSTFADWKSGRSVPKLPKLQKIADYFGVPVSYFTDEEPKEDTFSARDQRDIKRTLDKTLEALSSGEALMFDGEPIDEETTELLKSSIENSIRMAKALAKKKYTPKKYRKE